MLIFLLFLIFPEIHNIPPKLTKEIINPKKRIFLKLKKDQERKIELKIHLLCKTFNSDNFLVIGPQDSAYIFLVLDYN